MTKQEKEEVLKSSTIAVISNGLEGVEIKGVDNDDCILCTYLGKAHRVKIRYTSNDVTFRLNGQTFRLSDSMRVGL